MREGEREGGERERRQTDRQTEKEKENSKTLIIKDSSVRSFWTYLTASPCCTTNTNKTIILQTGIINTKKQLINAVPQSSYICAEAHD